MGSGVEGDRKVGLQLWDRVVAQLPSPGLSVVPVLLDPRQGAPELGQVPASFSWRMVGTAMKSGSSRSFHAPAKRRMFYSFGEGNAFELTSRQTINLSNKVIENKRPIKFISYSNKIKPEIQKIYQDIGVVENKRMKSSLKFCVVAAGEYDGYVAEPRAYEWDIAAGHAILIHSGGTVTDFNGNEILYGKKDLKNPSLILKSKNIL